MNNFKQQLAPGWSPVNIGLVVLLYLLSLWPVALIMLAYIIWGRKVGLDLSQPRTLSTFAKRLGTAWKAAINSFGNSGPT